METSQQTMVPFDKHIFATRLKLKHVTSNDLINYPSVKFSYSQLVYYKEKGMIPKEYYDQIEEALENLTYKECKRYVGRKYVGSLVDFGPLVYRDLLERCKKVNTSFTNVISLDHISSQTIYKYKKDRLIPSDLLEQINRRLRSMETETRKEDTVTVENKSVQKSDISSVTALNLEETTDKTEKHVPVEIVKKTVEPNYKKVIQALKTVIRCNGEANLNLDNISERYECDVETFVNSVFSLVSGEGYVIFTTYSNNKPVFTLSEPM